MTLWVPLNRLISNNPDRLCVDSSNLRCHITNFPLHGRCTRPDNLLPELRLSPQISRFDPFYSCWPRWDLISFLINELHLFNIRSDSSRRHFSLVSERVSNHFSVSVIADNGWDKVRFESFELCTLF